jgi:oligopeptide/dipeptide ABC transporter ATP-binding protein
MRDDRLLTVRNLKVSFHTDLGEVKAVDGINFDIARNETVGVVGESGCGKSMTSLAIMNMVPKLGGSIIGGSICYYPPESKPVMIASLKPNSKEMRNIRGAEISMIFQEPMASLTPVYTIGHQIVESLMLEPDMNKRTATEKAYQLLELVGITPPQQRFREYPHQLSGGMRQRAMIAMAICRDPNLLIADEPTTALDVTIEAQILDLLREMRNRFGMSLMIITHDLGVIGEMADRVIVMYMGKVVECASCKTLFSSPLHPYTQGLMHSIPVIGKKERLSTIKGSVPSPYDLPQGCSFSPRCPQAFERCFSEDPCEVIKETGHTVTCWLYANHSADCLSGGKV